MTRALVLRVIGAALLLGLLVAGCDALFTTDEERVGDVVDEAAEALSVRDAPRFLAVFESSVVYQADLDRARLAADVQRWCRAGLDRVVVLSREIEVPGDGTARAVVQAAAGSGLLNLVRVEATVDLVQQSDSSFLVRSFRWRRIRGER